MARPRRCFRIEFIEVENGSTGSDDEARNFWSAEAAADFIASLPAKRPGKPIILGVYRGDVSWSPVTPAEIEAVMT